MSSFIEKMAVLYQAVPSVLLVSVRIAQAIIESSWGQSELAINALNFAGIKASNGWVGETYAKTTKEEIDGKLLDVHGAKFRKYQHIEDFVKDHSNFITSTEWRKDRYAKVIEATTYQGQCAALTYTYASDSGYGRKLIEIIERYNLTQYDKEREVEKMTIKMPRILNKDFFARTAGKRLSEKPKYYIPHNDAGSATGAGYEGWLRSARTPHTSKAESGFAHYYISEDSILRAESTANATWSTASYDGNYNSIGYEICQEFSATNEQFIANEEMTFRQMAEDMTYYGDVPTVHNVKLHNEFSSTSCPKRSMELHGGREGFRQHVIARIKYYQSLGKTVAEMIDAENKLGGKDQVVEKPKETPKLNLNDVAKLVIKGRYGNGLERVNKLTSEGYDAKDVQKEVDRILGKDTTKRAEQTIAGTYKFNTTVNVRTAPSTGATRLAQYDPGETVNIDKIIQSQGYDWGEYKNYGGSMSYVALGKIDGERYTTKVK